jgi:hypothetical protein
MSRAKKRPQRGERSPKRKEFARISFLDFCPLSLLHTNPTNGSSQVSFAVVSVWVKKKVKEKRRR